MVGIFITSLAKTVNGPRSSLSIFKARSDASGATVDIQVPTALAPWTCLTNPKGEVENVVFNSTFLANLMDRSR